MYRLIHQDNITKLKDLPKGENLTNFSLLHDISEQFKFRSFSIKYVLEGTEHYQVNGNKYYVHKGEYLLANALCEGSVEIDSKKTVKGICIDVSPTLLSEVFSHFLTPDCPFPDIVLDDFFTTDAFLENKYTSEHTRLGKVLNALSNRLDKNPYYDYHLDKAFYFTLAENIVADHQSIIVELYKVNTIKHQTRKDLYRRLCRGKDFLENNLGEQLTISQAAEYATLSEYYFFRLFKSVFGLSPQQYLIQKRLAKAQALLRTGNYTVTEVSLTTGFADIYSFSKSFKKHFGVPPSLELRTV
jgi:AraC family transcriptional regulator